MKTDLNKLNRFTFSIIALIGLLLSYNLYIVYMNANFNPEAGSSFCVVNQYINCDLVAKTIYSRFLGIPLAIWGMGFYTLILFIALFPFHKFKLFKKFKHPKSYIFTMASIASVISVMLWAVSIFVIQKACYLVIFYI